MYNVHTYDGFRQKFGSLQDGHIINIELVKMLDVRYSLAEDGSVFEDGSEVVLVAEALVGAGVVERFIQHPLHPVDSLARPVQTELGL